MLRVDVGDGRAGSRREAGREADIVVAARRLLSDVSRLPRLWIAVVTLLAVVSTVEVTRTSSADVSARFHVTAVTAAILALAWLPAIVRAIVLTGGTVKTPAGEANTRGLLDLLRLLSPGVKREVLPPLAAALDSVQVEAVSVEERAEARMARGDIERELGRSIDPVGVPAEILGQHARDYERLRAEFSAGSERTFRMGVLMSEVRAVAGVVGVTRDLVTRLFESGREGDRIVALTLIEAQPLPECLPIVLDGISDSRSAFEQFQALRAAEELLPLLDKDARQLLGKVLAHGARTSTGRGCAKTQVAIIQSVKCSRKSMNRWASRRVHAGVSSRNHWTLRDNHRCTDPEGLSRAARPGR